MKPSRKHKISGAQRTKDGNRELREALTKQRQELEQMSRELEIEASLEKVRARAMAMQSSTELADLIAMIHDEMGRLDKNLDRSFIMLFNEDGSSTWWMKGNEKMPLDRGYNLPYHKHSPYLACLQGWKRRERTWRYVLKGSVKKKWDDFIFNKTEMAQLPKKVKSNMVGAKVAHWSSSFNKYGCISTGSFAEPSSFDLMVRFSRMFEQTYTRFLDLQKAEAQAREAQIEAALEKVRSSSLAMHQSDELQKVVSVLFNKLEDLGLAFDAMLIYTFDKGNKSICAWIASSILSSPVKVNLPFDDGMAKNQVIKDLWKATETREDMFNKVYSGKSKNDYILHSYKHNQSSIPKATKNLMIKARDWTVSFAAERNSVVGFDSWSGHITSEEDFRVLKRFSRVFEQAYTRFLDLQKAEAQAREAQIEVALEKIRSRSLAMHNSNELSDVIGVVFNQLNELKVLHSSVGIQLFDFNTKDSIIWPRNTLQGAAPKVMLPFDEVIMNADTCHRDLWQAMSTGKTIFNKVYTKKQKDRWFKYIFSNNSLDVIWESSRKTILQGGKYTVCFIPEKNSALIADSFDGSVYTDEEFMVLKRAAKVFEQAYIRFLDLQKAEGQAREAQIEAALEKVRSRTMAMQKSEELKEVAGLLFQQVAQLDIKTWTTGFNVWSDDGNAYTDYITSPQGNLIDPYTIDAIKFPVFVDVANARRSGVEFWISYLEGDLLKETYRQLAKFDSESQFEKMLEDGSQYPAHQYNHFVFGSKASLMFITYDPVPEAHDIFKRFGKVFEQTYTRFLDLQKAEAQTRESQIQLALERVRARTMAMQKSDELKEVASLLFTQVKELGINCWTTGFNVWSDDGDSYVDYVTNPVGEFMEPYTVDTTRHALLHDVAIARKKGDTFYVQFESGEDIIKTYQYLQEFGDKKQFQQILDSGFQFPTQQVDHFVFGVKTSLLFITYDQVPEAHDIFKRFGKAFEQTYTRFLDLQKAEAQARESQIEAALERVRSRTMAMHKSEELLDVITVVCEQLQHLGVKFGTVSFGKNSTSFDMDFWVASPDLKTPIKFYAPYTDISIYVRLKAAYRERKSFFTDTFTADEIKVWYQHVIDHNPSMFSQKSREYLLSRQDMTRTAVLLKNVILFIINHEVVTYSDEENEIFIRFATVFEQAYTRFLDLQKAEVQAREAQIDAALERLRARTMAMQRSLELTEVSQLLHHQFLSLGVQTITCAFMFPHEEKKTQSGWTVLPDGMLLPQVLDFPLLGDEVLNERYGSWKERKPVHRRTLESEENRRHHQFLSEQVSSIISKNIFTQLPPGKLTFTNANFAQGYLMAFTTDQLTVEEENILVRFAKVFEQTYTRFLDLQKAESQAREAKIEAALEKVRARTMGMQRSEELAEVAVLMFHQVKLFGLESWGCGFNIWDKDEKECTGWMSGPQGTGLIPPVRIPLTEHPLFIRFFETRKRGEDFWVQEMGGDELSGLYHYMDTLPVLGDQLRQAQTIGITPPTYQINHVVNFLHGNLIFITYEPCVESHDIFKRFGKVFEQTYTRFLDLQKAEAQARESQIQLALERVRARTMAMHHSKEVREVAMTMSDQLLQLGFEGRGCTIVLINAGTGDMEWWMGGFDESRFHRSYFIKNFDHPVHRAMLDGFIQGEKFKALRVSGELKRSFDDGFFINNGFQDLPDNVKGWMRALESADFSIAYNKHGGLHWAPDAITEEQATILQRFASVFEQTYTRFLDLKNAEAQAREAQIEAALEKIRSRSLAMHHSGELKEVVAIMFEKLKELNVLLGTIAIQLFDQSTMNCIFWVGNSLHDEPPRVKLPYDEKIMSEDGYMKDSWAWKIKGENFINREYTFDQKTRWFDYIFASNDFTTISEADRDIVRQSVIGPRCSYVVCLINEKNSSLFADSWNGEFYGEESIKVLSRAAKVFEQAYVRFLDLQKSEALAREAQVEAALERVRARAMAMHTAEELKDVAHELRKQIGLLGEKELETCVVHLNDESPDEVLAWAAVRAPNRDEEIREFHGAIPKKGLTIIEEALNAYSSGKKDYVIVNEGVKLEEWLEYMRKTLPTAYASSSASSSEAINIERVFWSFSDFQGGSLMMVTLAPPDSASQVLLRRFANVFGLAYRRFADLKKAEAQAREASIEAALEKIRSRSLGMHKSGEIKDVVSILFDKLKELGLEFDGRASIHLFSEGSKDAYVWVVSHELPEPARIDLPFDEEEFRDNPTIRDVWQAKETGAHIINRIYSKKEKDKYFRYIFKYNGDKLSDALKESIINADNYTVSFIAERNSLLGATSWSEQKFSASDVEVLKRVAHVFEQAYIRFLDLQKAEIHAKEAVRQASLDRVRAEIASMRTVQDLDRITPLIWSELTALNIPFIRCGVFIVDEQKKNVQSFLSTPDGKAIAVFELPFDTPGFVGDILKNWLAKKVYVNHLDDNAMKNFADILVARGIFSSVEHYLSTAPKEGFYQHLLPFRQGMLYVGNLTQLKEEELGTLQLLADAFATAYARYDDFNRLELAKKQVDATLVNLKQAQQQLVQSEKMASLGELTAGIAHEIQNPLNFVNNFSEVSHELMDEIKGEIEAGNLQAAADLINDIKQNLEKITHHGKRADGIVKGMLQHSRTGSGQKELTNINVLCDEYVRLAYHGYRAKDKSFNAKFETDFDSTLPKVNVIAQDIGRVVLNLINNAFYAVNERTKTETKDYSPAVIVSTKNLDNKIEVRVRDNGNGIPETIREKIFQPFFTTKPTGQGTGLGLSLSYDIIKAHGGTLLMNSKEGEGTEFTVQLPFFQLQTGT